MIVGRVARRWREAKLDPDRFRAEVTTAVERVLREHGEAAALEEQSYRVFYQQAPYHMFVAPEYVVNGPAVLDDIVREVERRGWQAIVSLAKGDWYPRSHLRGNRGPYKVHVEMMPAEGDALDVPPVLYHIADRHNVPSILSSGLRPSKARPWLPARVYLFRDENGVEEGLHLNSVRHSMGPRAEKLTSTPDTVVLEVDTAGLDLDLRDDPEWTGAGAYTLKHIPGSAIRVSKRKFRWASLTLRYREGGMGTLRSRIIRVAYTRPDLRPHLLAVLRTAKEWPSQDALDAYLKDHPNADPKKHSVQQQGESKKKDDESPKKKPAPAAPQVDEASLRTRAKKMKTPLDEDTRVSLLKLGVAKFPAPGVDPSTIRLHLDADPTTRAVAEWVDTKGNTQRAYAAEFHRRHAEEKWKRIEKVRPKLEKVRKSIQGKLKNEEPGSREHQAAAIAAVIAETGLRPGGREGSAEAGHFGVSTLQSDHVKFEGDEAHLEFVGKAGKKNVAVVRDPETVKALKHYAQEGGPLFDVGPEVARAVLPKGMKLKDLRTIVATETAERTLANLEKPPPLDKNPEKARKQLARAWVDASKVVAERLNNTPAIARAAYIHPAVFERWVESIGGGHLAEG